MWSVLLDANELVPSVRRDVLLEVAARGVYRPLWSSCILDETEKAIRAIRSRRGDSSEVTDAYLVRLRVQLGAAFPDALVTGWEPLSETFSLPDPDDRHVLAAALMGRADMILTENLKDFPAALLPAPIQARDADAFLMDSLDLQPDAVLDAVHVVAGRTGRHGPPRSPQEVAGAVGCSGFLAAFNGHCDRY